ncbi:hypothetical protein LEMLEM_LOCUS3946 [Lemmus lemmus]
MARVQTPAAGLGWLTSGKVVTSVKASVKCGSMCIAAPGKAPPRACASLPGQSPLSTSGTAVAGERLHFFLFSSRTVRCLHQGH